MEDVLGPTPEWAAKNEYEPRKVDRDTNRSTARAVSTFEKLFNAGDLQFYQWQTAKAFERHWYGAQGADVRLDDEPSSDPEMTGGLARAHHAGKIADAERHLNRIELIALLMIVKEQRGVEDIGRMVCFRTKRQIIRARGIGVLCSGLDRLAEMWGFQKKGRV